MPSDELLLLLLLLLPHSVSLAEAGREVLPGPCCAAPAAGAAAATSCLLGRLAKGFASNVVRLPFAR
jgi:hypothetical protein